MKKELKKLLDFLIQVHLAKLLHKAKLKKEKLFIEYRLQSDFYDFLREEYYRKWIDTK